MSTPSSLSSLARNWWCFSSTRWEARDPDLRFDGRRLNDAPAEHLGRRHLATHLLVHEKVMGRVPQQHDWPPRWRRTADAVARNAHLTP
jgi:hypothetical protein